MDLDGGFEEMGQFWPASESEPEHPWSGKITVDSNGSATLEVFSAFWDEGESSGDSLGGSPFPRRILGVTETNKTVTFDDARPIGGGGFIMGKASGIRRRRFWSDQVLFGRRYDEHEEVQFDSVTLSVEHAYEWFALSGLQSEEYSLERPVTMTLSYEEPTPIVFQLPRRIAGKVWFGFTGLTQPVPWDARLNFEQTCAISLDSYQDYWSLDDVKELSLIFQSFFSLVTASLAHLTSVDASLRGGSRERDQTAPPNVSVAYRPYSEDAIDSRTVHPNEMLFTYEDVQDAFDEAMTNWLSYWQSAEYAIRATMKSRFGHLTLDEHLKTLAQAVEVTVGKDRGKNVALEELVRYLAEMCWDEWEDDLDVDAFAAAVPKYRNWFVHFDRKKPRVEVDYGEVEAICHNLGAMLDIYMVSKCAPDSIPWRDLVTERGDLKWPLRKRLQLHPKHRRQAQPGDSSPNEAEDAD